MIGWFRFFELACVLFAVIAAAFSDYSWSAANWAAACYFHLQSLREKAEADNA